MKPVLFLFRFLLTMSLLFPLLARSGTYDWDSKASVGTGFPPFAASDVWLGASYLFKPVHIPRNGPLLTRIDRYSFTFIRPHVRLLTSGLTHRLAARLDVFPLSFFGITGGYALTRGSLEGIAGFESWTGVNCAQVNCSFKQRNPFLEMKARYAFASFFGEVVMRYDWLRETGTEDTHSYNPETGLLFQSEEDFSRHYWAVLGYVIKPFWNVASRWRHISIKQTQESIHALSVIVSHKLSNKWTLSSEVGASNRHTPFFAAIRAQYVLRDGPAPE